MKEDDPTRLVPYLVLTLYHPGERICPVLAGPIIFNTNYIYSVIDDSCNHFSDFLIRISGHKGLNY